MRAADISAALSRPAFKTSTCEAGKGGHMTDPIRLETEQAVVDVIPHLGGSLAGFDLKADDRTLPVLRRWSGESESPRTFACIPMVPFFARISGGGITIDGEFYPIERNDPEDTHPLHGDGWQSPWEIVEQDRTRIALRLRSRKIVPFDYESNLEYALDGAALTARLSIRNHAGRALPYGMGLHPWFPRTPDVTLQARMDGTWQVQPPVLPTRAEPDPLPASWDFSHGQQLPTEFIDNSFTGWDGQARITWPDQGYAVSVEADRSIKLTHVYAPDPDLPFFCFEQITHMIDAFNIPAPPEKTGLRVLQPGEQTEMWVRYAAERL
jgi:aldose 1-epimerase